MERIRVDYQATVAAFERMLPTRVARAVWEGEDDPGLYPVEEAAVASAVPKRVREFRRGRACARQALSHLGAPPMPLPVGDRRAPVWPEGFVGSITHSSELVAAAVARREDVLALGIDAEAAKPLPEGTQSVILDPSEVGESEDPILQTVVFSAKEAIHKAVFPLTGVWLEFLDVRVRLDVNGGRFAVRAHGPRARGVPELSLLQGHFQLVPGFVLTSALVEPRRQDGEPS